MIVDTSAVTELSTPIDQLPIFEPEDVHELHHQAASLHARCRWQGLAVPSPNDCEMAAGALAADMPLLACDRDFVAWVQIEPKLKSSP